MSKINERKEESKIKSRKVHFSSFYSLICPFIQTKLLAVCLVLWIQGANTVALLPEERSLGWEADIEEYGVFGSVYSQGNIAG